MKDPGMMLPLLPISEVGPASIMKQRAVSWGIRTTLLTLADLEIPMTLLHPLVAVEAVEVEMAGPRMVLLDHRVAGVVVVVAIRAVFQDHQVVVLHTGCKGSDRLATYIVEFNHLAPLTRWGKNALRHQFYEGLPRWIKDKMVHQNYTNSRLGIKQVMCRIDT
ncbi:hypothetical protein B0H17DRAFT_1198903 [Mycena rosella]|uniref:Uncharacterized protein n=1 Tax=Mycena rosella TaxID=1033263 RepID=A0AAD7DQI7_MYCRO|nr:hypothetical protein B0H17DRAFT_1198903 [Mycena rosella]